MVMLSPILLPIAGVLKVTGEGEVFIYNLEWVDMGKILTHKVCNNAEEQSELGYW